MVAVLSLLRELRIPARGLLLAGVLALCAVEATLAVASPAQTVHARLTPVSPAKRGSGSLTATGGSGQTVIVRWQLSVANLTGPVRRATLQTPGPNPRVFALCQPCKAKARGQIALVRSVWTRIAAGGGSVVVATRAYPRGELRGIVKRG